MSKDSDETANMWFRVLCAHTSDDELGALSHRLAARAEQIEGRKAKRSPKTDTGNVVQLFD